ncbi:MAG: hypothetical protein ACR2P8_01420 [Myxococcota bacterium]
MRIEPLSDAEAGWSVRLLKWVVRRRLRMERSSSAYNLLARHKRVLASTVGYMAILDRWNRLPRRLKRLVHLRVAMRVGCPA